VLCALGPDDPEWLPDLAAYTLDATVVRLDRPEELMRWHGEDRLLLASISRLRVGAWWTALLRHRRRSSCPVIVLVRSEDLLTAAPFADLLDALLFLDLPPRHLVPALQLALSGFVAIPGNKPLPVTLEDTRRERLAELPDDERRVLQLVAQGLTNAAIGQRLGFSEARVKRAVKHVLEDLGLRNRTEAAVLVQRLGVDLTARPDMQSRSTH